MVKKHSRLDNPQNLHPREVARRLGVSRGTLRRCGEDGNRTVEQIAALIDEQPQWLIEGRAATASRKQQQRELGARRERREQKATADAQRMLDAYKDGRGL
ncbi:DUF5997 family protein [Actinoplanes sp. CA-030573]|uniref:DUF5997 family protein n=1 Tax=Actinoplanes sp. CA-030573 TaxID=3239898 RepID=UPI003D93DAD5